LPPEGRLLLSACHSLFVTIQVAPTKHFFLKNQSGRA
jgi:hypothetical protein